MEEAALEIRPVSTIRGTVRPPGSKSYTNRALLVAALADGPTILKNALFSDDSKVMTAALRKLGIAVSEEPGASRITVEGASGPAPVKQAIIDAGNAGTAMRFLTPYLTLGKGNFTIDGSPRMRQRPIAELESALRQLGADIESAGGFPPVRIIAKGLPGGTAQVDASRSSQFLSGLLLASPYAGERVEIKLVRDPVSRPYIDMTLNVMAAFGVAVEREGYRIFRIASGQHYRAAEYAVEADASSASYFLAAAAISGGQIRIEGVGKESLQADARFGRILAEMGCQVAYEPHATELNGKPLKGITVDLSDAPDLVPALAVTSVFAATPTRITNVANLRIKESDRIAALAAELTKAGIRVKEYPDGLEIRPGEPTGAAFDTYNDHRIAMSLSLLGLRTKGVIIKDPGCVSKTYPAFFEDLESVSIR